MKDIRTFSTENIVPEDRPRLVSEAISEVLTTLDISEPDGKPLEATVKSVELENTVLASFDLGPFVFDRDSKMVEDGDDRFSLVTCVGGSYDTTMTGMVGQNSIKVVSGMASLFSHLTPMRTVARGASQEKTLVFPRELISHALRNPDERIGMVPEGGMVAIRLMASYMSGLLEEEKSISSKTQKMIEGHVLDLVANAYDPGGEWSRAAPNDGVNAAQLQQILRHVSESYADRSLKAESIATLCGVSERKVHQLLTTTGTTLSQHILEHRLQAARQALQNERLISKRVSEIAMDAGFSDLSYFNKCFRRRFGDTPNGFRPHKAKPAHKAN